MAQAEAGLQTSMQEEAGNLEKPGEGPGFS